MIEELRIQNFQAHKKLRIKFGPNITTIVGPSDVGKSAILRALRWVATNQPGGDDFVRDGAGGCTVRLVADGVAVTRKRKSGGSVNTYTLGRQDYKAFGRGVPEPVELHLNMPPVCWQRQHDPSFWFGETPGEVSRQLNAIVDLGIIDHALANAARVFNRARTRLELTEEAVTTAKAEQDGLAWAALVDEALRGVEGRYAEAVAATERAATLRNAVLGVGTAITAHTAACARDAATTTLYRAARAAYTTARAATALRRAVQVCHGAAARVGAPPPDNRLLEDAHGRYQTTALRRTVLTAILDTAKQKKDNLCHLEKQLNEAEATLPKVCPVCGRC